MSLESEQLLQKTLTIVEENNKMLHKIRGVQKREAFWHVLKLIVIIGLTFGSFYFLEPYLNKVTNLYNSISGIQQNIKDVQSNSLKNLLKKF